MYTALGILTLFRRAWFAKGESRKDSNSDQTQEANLAPHNDHLNGHMGKGRNNYFRESTSRVLTSLWEVIPSIIVLVYM